LIYLDTSALAAIYIPQAASDRIEALVTAQRRRAISLLSQFEICSALSRRVVQRTP
jgi:predicted nucleic acid-binding protein